MAIGEVNMSSKRYTEEFKIEAVRQVIDRGYSVVTTQIQRTLILGWTSLPNALELFGPGFFGSFFQWSAVRNKRHETTTAAPDFADQHKLAGTGY